MISCKKGRAYSARRNEWRVPGPALSLLAPARAITGRAFSPEDFWKKSLTQETGRFRPKEDVPVYRLGGWSACLEREGEECGYGQACECDEVIPGEFLLQECERKDDEDGERDDLLNDLELES